MPTHSQRSRSNSSAKKSRSLVDARPTSSPVRRRPHPPILANKRRLSLPAVNAEKHAAFVSAGFGRGAMVERSKTPYLAGGVDERAGGGSTSCRLPQIQLQAASNRLADDAAEREERRRKLTEKVWQTRDRDTRWNKRNVKKEEVEAGVDRLFRGGVEWLDQKRENERKLKEALDAPKGFRRYTLNEETGKLEEVVQEFEKLPREVCAGKLQCQYYEGVNFYRKAHLRNIEHVMGPLDDKEKRLLHLDDGGDGGGDVKRSSIASDEKVQEYVEKAKAEYRAARDRRREFEKRDKEFHRQVSEAEAKWAARCSELDQQKVEARQQMLAEEAAWLSRRAELEAERAAEHKAAKRQLEEQRRAYEAKMAAFTQAREEAFAKRLEELMEQDRKHNAEQSAREAARVEVMRAQKMSERERERRIAEERAKPVDTDLARERREWDAKYADLRAAERRARREEQTKNKQMMRQTDAAYKAKLAEIGARCDAEIAERRRATVEYERKIRADEKAREAARLENIARAKAEDRERKKIHEDKLAAKAREAAAKARADFAVAEGGGQPTKKMRKTSKITA